MKTNVKYIMLIVCALLMSCEKSFLEKKPDKSIVIPTTYKDFQALLDNELKMNVAPGLTAISGEDYNLEEDIYSNLSTIEKNLYVWDPDPYVGKEVMDWSNLFSQIFYANVVLDGLDKANATQQQKDKLRGSALFYRGFAYYNLAQLFCAAYHESNLETDQGLPLKRSSSVEETLKRSSIEETYQFIIGDLEYAAELLDVEAEKKSRPSKRAAYALLSKVYLSMQHYKEAGAYANKCLSYPYELMDYKLLDIDSFTPIPGFNQEVIFNALMFSYLIMSKELIPQKVYDNYEKGDLRRDVFIRKDEKGNYRIKARHSGTGQYYGGISVDEILLIRAESAARENNIQEAVGDLNELRKTRFKENSNWQVNAESRREALQLVLEEREKELLFRGTRWTDLRRLNFEQEFQQVLRRKVANTEFTLAPFDLRYTLLIPSNEISFGHLDQNER